MLFGWSGSIKGLPFPVGHLEELRGRLFLQAIWKLTDCLLQTSPWGHSQTNSVLLKIWVFVSWNPIPRHETVSFNSISKVRRNGHSFKRYLHTKNAFESFSVVLERRQSSSRDDDEDEPLSGVLKQRHSSKRVFTQRNEDTGWGWSSLMSSNSL